MKVSRWIVAALAAGVTALWACSGAEPTAPTQPTGGNGTPNPPNNPPPPNPTPNPPASGYSLSLLFSNPNAGVGSQVTAYVHANHDSSAAKLASFRANLVLDTTALAYAGSVDRAGNGFVAVNLVNPVVVGIVGAAFPQFSSDTLAAVLLTVKKAGALTNLGVGMQEMTTPDFVSRIP